MKIVESIVGRFARPENIILVKDLPRTRTGKLVRRVIKAKTSGTDIGAQDLSIIENPESLNYISTIF